MNFDAALQDHFENHLQPSPDPTFIPIAKRAIGIMTEVCLGVRTRLDAHASFEHSDGMTPSEICCGMHLDGFVARKCVEISDAN